MADSRTEFHGALRWGVALALCLAAGGGCGVVKKVKEKLNPKASVIRVEILETTPEYMRIRVDVKTEDADLLMGFLKLKYNFLLDQVSMEHKDNVQKAELKELHKSGLSFVVMIPLEKAKGEGSLLRFEIQGAIVVKIIAEIAEVPFHIKSSIPLK